MPCNIEHNTVHHKHTSQCYQHWNINPNSALTSNICITYTQDILIGFIIHCLFMNQEWEFNTNSGDVFTHKCYENTSTSSFTTFDSDGILHSVFATFFLLTWITIFYEHWIDRLLNIIIIIFKTFSWFLFFA